MTERDWIIWAAGFVDGEGCISVNKQKMTRQSKTGSRLWMSYTLGIAVSQKTKAPLERLHSMFGGHLFSYQSCGNTYWRWQHWSHGALEAIKAMLPYLLVKRAIAECGIRFQEQMTQWNAEFGRRGYPEEVVVGRETFYLEARELNTRNRANHRAPKYVGPQTKLEVTEQSVN
jgi:hypothetical protein